MYTLDTSGRGVCGFESWPKRGGLSGRDSYLALCLTEDSKQG